MGTMPRLVSVLLLGLGVAVAGCTTTNSAKDKTTYKGDRTPTFVGNKEATAKQTDTAPFQVKNTTAPVGQGPVTTSSLVGDPAPIGGQPVSTFNGANNNLLNNPPTPAAPPVGNTSAVVFPPRPSGEAQLTNTSAATSTLRIGYGEQAPHAPEVVAIPTETAPSTSQGTPLPPIVQTSAVAPLPPTPMQVPPPATTSNYTAPPVPSYSAGNIANPPPLPPLPSAR